MAFTTKTAKQAGKKSSREGSPNKTTQEIRELIKNLIEDNVIKLQADLNGLEPKDRIKAFVDLAKFVLPTLKSQEIHGGGNESITIRREIIK